LPIEAGREAGRFALRQKEALKAEVARRLGLSPRNVNRYLLLLDAPAPVQQAFDRGDLSLTDAGKVALLDRPARADIVRRLQQGEKAGQVVAASLARPDGGDDVGRSFRRLGGALARETSRLRGRLAEIPQSRLRHRLPALKAARRLLADLIRRAGR
jgi:hypothetical protein